jgi:hypothetical protein
MSDLTPGRPDLAIAAVLGAARPARCRVSVDLSHAENSARRAVEFDDCDWVPAIGDLVDACDLIDQREATAEVVGIDERERLVRIAIDWTTVRKVTA